MRDDWRRELEEEWELNEDDRALLEHVLGDDEALPQGLHQGGRAAAQSHEDEDEIVSDYYFPWGMDDDI